MRQEPTFALAVAATLSIGIGASTAVFGVASATLLSRIPYESAERLAIGGSTRDGRPELGHVSGLDYFDYRDSNRSFDDLAAFNPFPMPATVTGVGEPWEVQTGFVTWNLLRTLRVAPVLGRSFLPAEEAQADAQVVLISFAVWQSRFAGAPRRRRADAHARRRSADHRRRPAGGAPLRRCGPARRRRAVEHAPR